MSKMYLLTSLTLVLMLNVFVLNFVVGWLISVSNRKQKTIRKWEDRESLEIFPVKYETWDEYTKRIES